MADPKLEPKQESKDVVIEKSTLDGLIARLEALEKEKEAHQYNAGLNTNPGEWKTVKEDRKEFKAHLRKWRASASEDFMYAVDWHWERNEFNEKTREMELIYKIKWLQKDDKTTETEMTINNFVKLTEREEVTISDKKTEKLERVTGEWAEVKKVNFDKYNSVVVGKLPMKVTAENVTWLASLKDGRKFRINADRLNA